MPHPSAVCLRTYRHFFLPCFDVSWTHGVVSKNGQRERLPPLPRTDDQAARFLHAFLNRALLCRRTCFQICGISAFRSVAWRTLSRMPFVSSRVPCPDPFPANLEPCHEPPPGLRQSTSTDFHAHAEKLLATAVYFFFSNGHHCF